jgi:hypothetical protein
MNLVLRVGWVVAVVFAVAITGCGGSETESTAGTTAASKVGRNKSKLRWEWHATMACKKGMEQADVVMHKAAGRPAPKPPSAAPDWESFKVPVKVLLPTFRQTAEELEEVEVDDQDVSDYGRLLEKLRMELKQAERHPDAPVSSRPLASAGKAAYVYGIHACLY